MEKDNNKQQQVNDEDDFDSILDDCAQDLDKKLNISGQQ